MNNSLITVICLAIIFSCRNTHSNNVNNFQIDSVFKNWNNSTLASLNSHIVSTTGKSESNFYKNRLSAFKTFVDIDNGGEINKRSIRYEFLKTIKVGDLVNDFCIIEANSSGESVQLKNYLIKPEEKKVDTYCFIENRWTIVKAESISLSEAAKIKTYITDFGSGINQDDIIVSFFYNNGRCSSEYYLFTTLSNYNPWKRILFPNKARIQEY